MVATDSTASAPTSNKVAQVSYELLTLGDELLLGLTTNSHLTFIGQQLALHGAKLRRNVTITDDAQAIAEQFRESWRRSDVVITTGGLGPTCDDRTREAIAEALSTKLLHDPAIERAIEERFAKHGRKMTPNNRKQAFYFEGGEVLPNANGTAPGLWLEKDGKVLCMLPGPPVELHPLFQEQVVPRLVQRGLLTSGEAYVQIRTVGIGESALEHKLQPLFDAHGSDLDVAFCAHHGQVDLRLSSASGALGQGKLRQVAAECAVLLGEDFMCFGHDSLARIVADLLRRTDAKLAVAETATGGLLADAFTNVPGVSKCFAGGCVCYSNESKTQLLEVPEEIMLQHGAVSEETAVAMATGAAEKLGADYGLAITGFAGPCGGNQHNPVGTIFLALYAPHGVWSKKLSYPGPRLMVKERAVNAALDWLRRELLRNGCVGHGA